MKRLLTIGHSYVVTENRRLAHEIGVQGRGRWAVTAIAPRRFRGDLGPIDARAEQGEALDLRTVPVLLDRRIHLMRYSRLGAAMEGNWDVVHAWEEPYIAAGAQIAAHVPPAAKLVFATFQNLAKDYPWPLASYERRAMERADAWIAFGELVKEALASRPAYAARPCRVIPPGVDTHRFRPDAVRGSDTRRHLGWDDRTPVAGFLGRFEPQKGLELLCAALERVTGPWHALFVGGGTQEPFLRAFEARHPSRVRIVTGVAHSDVPRWLNAMSILCAPSQTTAGWREQFGRMIVEAMASGVAVAGSDSGEIPYVIGDAGLILAERDVGAWAGAIDQLLQRPELRREYAARGIERACARFAWPVVARSHLAWFEEVLAQ
jgi:glycosyltransferase involved in cell wall biosynthesis